MLAKVELTDEYYPVSQTKREIINKGRVPCMIQVQFLIAAPGAKPKFGKHMEQILKKYFLLDFMIILMMKKL